MNALKIISNFRYCLAIIGILLYVPLAWSQQDPYHFSFNTRHGLPSSETYDVFADKDNLIWILTDRGICTFNGHEFQTYTTQDGLAFNTNFQAYEDFKGRFWFTGFDGSLTVFEDGRFRPFKYNHILSKLNPFSWLENLSFDGDHIVFSYHHYQKKQSNKDLYRISTKTGKVERDSGEMLKGFSSNGHIYEYRKLGNGYFLVIDDRFVSKHPKLTPDSLLVGFAGQTFFSLNFKTNELTDCVLGSNINNCILYPDGTIWACTNKGLFHFRDNQFDAPAEFFFSGLTPSGLVMDMEGNHWISTLEKGILLVPSFEVKRLIGDNHPLNNEKILSFQVLGEHLLFGTSNGNLYSIDKNYSFDPVLLSNSGRQIKKISKGADGTILFEQKAVNEIHGKISVKENQKFSYHQWIDCSLFKDLSDGNFFRGSPNGFTVWNGEEDLLLIRKSPLPDKLTCIEEDSLGHIWIGTMKGLLKFSWPGSKSLQKVFENHPFSNTRFSDLKFAPNGDLWATTIGDGILHLSKGQVTKISQKEGLPSNMVNRLYLEGDTGIWGATNKGLFHFTYRSADLPKVKNIRRYTVKDGLPSDFINDVAKWNGQIWVATDRGIAYFQKEHLNPPQPPPTTVIDVVLSDGQDFKDRKGYMFPPTQNDFLFKFTGISNRREEFLPFYEYKLEKEGQKARWIKTNDRNVNFMDIPPDSYTFLVRSRNRVGEWGKATGYHFEVSPRFTQTLFFKVSATVLFVLSTILLTSAYVQYQKNKEKQKRAVQEMQLKTREAELAALRSQMNPHFIFNALNAVQNFIFKNDKEKANYFLSNFSGLVRKVLAYSRLEFIGLDKEMEFISKYMEMENMRFPGKFTYSIDVEESLSSTGLEVPPFMIQPLIENSINHGFKGIAHTGKIEIHFLSHPTAGAIEVVIRDNGNGMPKLGMGEFQGNSEKKSFGLDIVRERIRLLNGKLENSHASVIVDENIQSGGVKIKLTLPVLKNDA